VNVPRTLLSSALRRVAVGSTPWKVWPAASGLAVTTIFSMPGGTEAVSMVIEPGFGPPPER
jgi:hypothetical protein